MSEETDLQPTVIRNSRGLSINGTRITLYHIMDYVRAGHPPAIIQDSFRLTDLQIADVLAYIEEHRSEVEAEYQQVVQEDEEVRRYWEERNQERFAAIAAMPPRPEQAEIRAKLAAFKASVGLE